ncbi:RDD family protein [Corynebacterium sp.]|uniref:RDD family protein n=1 Tax=Corynebacterium sp. TaxID=1720 RepID=UPI0026DDC981|nr:RDD family protein [Corynebacterium sp.]MDO5031177.1 RDD family protein [Corynebacterium sp.]
MTSNALAPNLYSHFSLDPHATSRELGILLAAKDARLEGMGVSLGDEQRQQLQIAHSILSSPETRATYDEGLDEGLRPTWSQLSEVAAYGEWPYGMQASASAQQSPFAAPAAPPTATASQSPFHVDPFGQNNLQQGAAQLAPYGVAYGMGPNSPRATMGTRVAMALIDSVIALFMVGIVGAVAFDASSSDFVTLFGTSLLGVAYFVLFESVLGATPAKMLMGYEVRNAETGEKLSITESAKRQWWRLVSLVPGIGPLASMACAVYVVSTINPNNELRGQHDRLANAEVVKRQRPQ